MIDPEIQNAKEAFSKVLPDVEFRAGAAAPRLSRTGRKAAVTAGTSAVVVAAFFAATAATPVAAWSPTPSSLSASDSKRIDDACRAASTDVVIVNSDGTSGSGQISGEVGSQTTVDPNSGDSGVVGKTTTETGSAEVGTNTGSGASIGDMNTTSTVTVGSLPLLFIDSRGKMALGRLW